MFFFWTNTFSHLVIIEITWALVTFTVICLITFAVQSYRITECTVYSGSFTPDNFLGQQWLQDTLPLSIQTSSLPELRFAYVDFSAFSSNCQLSFSLSLQLLLICLEPPEEETAALARTRHPCTSSGFSRSTKPVFKFSSLLLLLLNMALCGLAWYFRPPNEALNPVMLETGHSLCLLCLNVNKKTLCISISPQLGFMHLHAWVWVKSLFDPYLIKKKKINDLHYALIYFIMV